MTKTIDKKEILKALITESKRRLVVQELMVEYYQKKSLQNAQFEPHLKTAEIDKKATKDILEFYESKLK